MRSAPDSGSTAHAARRITSFLNLFLWYKQSAVRTSSERTTRFAGVELATSPLVMAPRTKSAALVELAVDELGGRPGRVVDAGTGSGAIAIAIARAAPSATVWATDISGPALELAAANARRAGVADRVHVRYGDPLGAVPRRAEVIVANLPYLPHAERHLHPELWDEPERAVFAPGDGLSVVRQLVGAASDRLAPAGLLALQLRDGIVVARQHELPVLARRLAPLAAAA
jgi:release factor glutamine methyltransferase